MDFPYFSIVIPTYNRPKRLANCLNAVARLDYLRDRFEVIVVDDGSDTPLDSVVALLQDKMQIKLLRQKNAGPAAARNLGVAEARGEYIAFTDDDCQPTADWLTQFAAAAKSAPEALLGGKTINALTDNPFSTASQTLTDYLYKYFDPAKTKNAFFTSNNMAMPIANFKALNGFDVSFPLAAAEDRDLCDRSNRVYPMVYVPTAKIEHFHKLNLISFWKQHFSYGRGAFNFYKTGFERSSQVTKVKQLSFYSQLLFYPFTENLTQPKILISSLFFLSQIANVAGYFWEKYNLNFGIKDYYE